MDENAAVCTDPLAAKSWLAVVVTPCKKVESASLIVLGKRLAYGDVYITVQWLECIGGCEYELSELQDCIWEISSVMPVSSKLGTYKLPTTTAKKRKSRQPYKLSQQAVNEMKYLE